MRGSTNPTSLSYFVPGHPTFSPSPALVRRRTLPFRLLAFLGVGWVQFVLAGPGVHDPDCVHHRPGATGAAHVQGAASGTEHSHHASGHGAPQPGTPAEGQDADRPSDEECRCQGLCVPGAVVGLTVPQDGVDAALPPALAVTSVAATDADAVLPPLPTLLPPSTGPPPTA